MLDINRRRAPISPSTYIHIGEIYSITPAICMYMWPLTYVLLWRVNIIPETGHIVPRMSWLTVNTGGITSGLSPGTFDFADNDLRYGLCPVLHYQCSNIVGYIFCRITVWQVFAIFGLTTFISHLLPSSKTLAIHNHSCWLAVNPN